MLRRRLVLTVALAFMAASACASSHSPSGTSATTETSVPPTTQAPQPLVGWTGGPLGAPLEADDNALVVGAGDPPPDVTQDQALALAEQAVGPQMWSGATTQAFPGIAALSPQVVQSSVGVHQVTNAAAWIVAYRSSVRPACPYMTPPPPTASDLDAVIITGPNIDQAVVYHGTGGGICRNAPTPVVVSATRL
jgi:hypothetical protein